SKRFLRRCIPSLQPEAFRLCWRESVMAGLLEFTLNGGLVRIDEYSPNTTLLEYLRGIGLTGSKEGCAEGDCGACSVAILDRDSQGQSTYRAINSCLVPVSLMAGREIISAEGVGGKCNIQHPTSNIQNAKSASPALHPVQQRMVECKGSQCGYCTPGV